MIGIPQVADLSSTNDVMYVHNEMIESVDRFVYVDSVLNSDGGSKTPNTSVIEISNSRICFLYMKLRLFNTSVKSGLLYGAKNYY